jgi:hypothetical protein
MAYKTFDELGSQANVGSPSTALHFDALNDAQIALPETAFIKDAEFTRDGQDLILKTADSTATIENYFSAADAPTLAGPEGNVLTPDLINSFTSTPQLYASNETASDASPIGYVDEILGDATITRVDGSTEPMTQGMNVFQGDIVETTDDGAVNLVFADDSSFAVSEDTRMALDEFVYDPSTESGVQNFSVLKGVFVYTSGLIGREDPDDVQIDTPVGSIGIRGTIIAGDVNAGEITVVEGAIVLTDPNGNQMTLSNQFETGKFTADNGIENQGQISAQDMANKFSGVAPVAANLFSSIADTANEPSGDEGQQDEQKTEASEDSEQQDAQETEDQAEDGKQGDDAAEDAQAGDADESQAEKSQTEGSQADAESADDGTDAASDTQNDDSAATGEESQAGDAQEGGDDARGKTPAQNAEKAANAAEAGENAADTPPADLPAQNTLQNANGLGEKLGIGPNNNTNNGNDVKQGARGPRAALQELQDSLGGDDGVRDLGPNGPNGLNPFDPSDFPLPLNGSNAEGTAAVVDGVQITMNVIPEHVATSTSVATIGNAIIGGQTAIISTIALDEAANNFFDIINNGDGTFEIITKFAEAFDFEGNPMDGINFDIEITTDLGPVTQHIDVILSNVDEGIDHEFSTPGEAFAATSNMVFQYDFSNDFKDADGSNLTFTFDDVDGDFAGNADLSYVFDDNTGILTITTGASVTTSTVLDFEINVVNDENPAESLLNTAYTFDLFSENLTGVGPDGVNANVKLFEGSGITYSAESGINSFYVATTTAGADNNNIFGSANIDFFTIGATGQSGDNNTIHGLDGNDIFTLNTTAQYNKVLGGDGDDTFKIRNGKNDMFGMNGDDTFEFDIGVTGSIVGLNNFLGATPASINGGEGFDRITLTGQGAGGGGTGPGLIFDGGTSQLDAAKINNIEMLDVRNSDANTVVLNYGDLMAITDDENHLMIRGDANDILNFSFAADGADGNSRAFDMYHEGTETHGGEEYNVYSSGEVTLLVDTDITVQGDLVGIGV